MMAKKNLKRRDTCYVMELEFILSKLDINLPGGVHEKTYRQGFYGSIKDRNFSLTTEFCEEFLPLFIELCMKFLPISSTSTLFQLNARPKYNGETWNSASGLKCLNGVKIAQDHSYSK